MSDTLMLRAIALGEQGRLTAPPNPWVGAVVVNKGSVVGEGFHSKAGTPHAEVHALAQAGEKARGGDIYVTLEPCSHHGRTPPCVDAILQAGLRRVFIAVTDPDPKVNGSGVDLLRNAGVEVVTGVAAKEASASLAPYLHHRRTGLPYVWLKAATTADGRMAAADGTSRWISGEEARRDAHHLRAASQAVLVGAGTAVADRPQLTVRDIPLPEGYKPPLRCLYAPVGGVTHEGPLFDRTLGETRIFSQKSLPDLLRELGNEGILQLLVEGGSHLHTQFLLQGLAQKLTLYVGPSLLGESGLPLFRHPIPSISERFPLHLLEVERVGDTVRIDYALREQKDG